MRLYYNIENLIYQTLKEKIKEVFPLELKANNGNDVYKVTVQSYSKYTVKVFHDKHRFNRELLMLKLLNQGKCKCPKLITSNQIHENLFILVITFIEGINFDKVPMKEVKYKEFIKIFYEIGLDIGRIHSTIVLDSNGEKIVKKNYHIDVLNSYQKFRDETKAYKNLAVKIINRETSLLQKSFDFIEKNCEIILDFPKYELTHNDLNPKNIIISNCSSNWQYKGIIDFERSRFSNTIPDFIHLYMCFFLDNNSFEESFFKGYLKLCFFEKNNDFKKILKLYLLKFGLDIVVRNYPQGLASYKEAISLLSKLN